MKGQEVISAISIKQTKHGLWKGKIIHQSMVTIYETGFLATPELCWEKINKWNGGEP